MMRVAHFRTTFSSLTETFVYDTVLETQRQGARPVVLTLRRENAGQRPFDDVRLLRSPGRRDPRRWLRWVVAWYRNEIPGSHLWPYIRGELRRALEADRPDVLHAHFGVEGTIAFPVARALGIPLVVSHHGFDVTRLPRDPRWRELYQAMWRTAAVVTVVSDRMRGLVTALGCPADRVSVVHVGKDMNSYPYRPPAGPVRRLVSVGRFEEKKRHLDAIRAVHQVVAAGASLSLSIIGDGPLFAEAREYVEAQGLEASVELLGARPHDETRERVRAADAFILCSSTASDGDEEGIPTVLMEAQALGLPCVSTRHAGIPEGIPQANHWLLAEPGDIDSIVDRLGRLLSAPQETLLRVSRHGRENVEAEFNLETETRKLLRLYAVVCGSAGADDVAEPAWTGVPRRRRAEDGHAHSS